MENIIESCNIEEFCGSIVTNRYKLSWVFDEEAQCCESYGSEISEKSIREDQLVGANMYNYAIEEDHSYENQECDLIIRTSEGNYVHHFYNHHNGYYSHSLCVYKDDKIIMECCL